LGKIFLILCEFINTTPSSCRATLFDFLPFLLLIFLGESCGCPFPTLTHRCPISPCVNLSPLDFPSSRWYIVNALAFPLLQYLREIDPFPFHNVYEIRILCSYIAWSHFCIFVYLLHGGGGIFGFSFHRICATPLSHTLSWAICILIGSLFPDLFIFCFFLSSFLLFVGLVPSFFFILGLQVSPYWGFTLFLVSSVSVVWFYKRIFVLL
jgi:hypothetical protein